MKSGIMEPGHSSHTSFLGAVVDEGAVALRDEKYAFDGFGRLPRKMVLQIRNVGPSGEIAHPKGMSGLFGLPRRPSWSGRDGSSGGTGAPFMDRCRGLKPSARSAAQNQIESITWYASGSQERSSSWISIWRSRTLSENAMRKKPTGEGPRIGIMVGQTRVSQRITGWPGIRGGVWSLRRLHGMLLLPTLRSTLAWVVQVCWCLLGWKILLSGENLLVCAGPSRM